MLLDTINYYRKEKKYYKYNSEYYDSHMLKDKSNAASVANGLKKNKYLIQVSFKSYMCTVYPEFIVLKTLSTKLIRIKFN